MAGGFYGCITRTDKKCMRKKVISLLKCGLTATVTTILVYCKVDKNLHKVNRRKTVI